MNLNNAFGLTGLRFARYFHGLWLSIDQAINENGIKEGKIRDQGLLDEETEKELEDCLRVVNEEAEHAALRITALVSHEAMSAVLIVKDFGTHLEWVPKT